MFATSINHEIADIDPSDELYFISVFGLMIYIDIANSYRSNRFSFCGNLRLIKPETRTSGYLVP